MQYILSKSLKNCKENFFFENKFVAKQTKCQEKYI